MSFEACAAIVEKGDPDRFLATMAAPVAARCVLFPLYAFNVEISRAPWASDEPLIAEMRLQWWVDALDEIQSGGAVRKHEVTLPLAEILTADTAQMLKACVEARRCDAHRQRFTSKDDLSAYVKQTAGTLHKVAVRALGETNYDGWATSVGSGLGLANYLIGVPVFLARGINPLPDMTEAEMHVLLTDHASKLIGGTGKPSQMVRIADLSAWRATGILTRALNDQTAIVDGRLGGSEFARRAGLLWRGLRT